MDGLAFCVASWPVLVVVVFFSKIFYGISRKAFGLVGKVLKARGSARHVKQRWVPCNFLRGMRYAQYCQEGEQQHGQLRSMPGVSVRWSARHVR